MVAAGEYWVRKELAFYDNGCSSSSYRPVKSGTSKTVRLKQLQAAVEEFSQRFSPITVEQHEDNLAKPTKKVDAQGAPVLLVSTHVKPDWTYPW